MCQPPLNLPKGWSSTCATGRGCVVSKLVYSVPFLSSVPPVHLFMQLLCEPGRQTDMIKNTSSQFNLALILRKRFSFGRKHREV